MASIATELLRSVAADLARISLEPVDLTSIAAQLGSQLEGLARLDDLELLSVEPATVVVPPAEVSDAGR